MRATNNEEAVIETGGMCAIHHEVRVVPILAPRNTLVVGGGLLWRPPCEALGQRLQLWLQRRRVALALGSDQSGGRRSKRQHRQTRHCSTTHTLSLPFAVSCGPVGAQPSKTTRTGSAGDGDAQAS